jgi:hypothetical protein
LRVIGSSEKFGQRFGSCLNLVAIVHEAFDGAIAPMSVVDFHAKVVSTACRASVSISETPTVRSVFDLWPRFF